MANRVVKYNHNHKAKVLSDKVTEKHFGSGYENRNQSIDDGTPFRKVESQLDLKFLRYPGGTQTENYFDPGDPNNSKPVGIFNNVGKPANFTPIKDFLTFTSKENIEPVIVIPTWRYFDQKTGSVKSGAEAEIKGFVKDVLSGKHGETKVQAFEIGNEWSNENFSWTPGQFGKLQAKIATWIDDVKSGLKLSYDPKVLAQTTHTGTRDLDKNGVNDNVEILAAFKGQEMKLIDGVIDHFYQPTRAGNVLDETYFSSAWVPQNRINKLIEDGWNVKGKDALDIFVTEWNVRDSDRANEQTITGFERFPMFLRLFSEMQMAGVDAATIFTTQALGVSHAPLSRLGEDTLTPTGHLFKMMKDALPGTQLNDPNGDGSLSRSEFVFKDSAGKEAGFTYTYSSENKKVVYFSSAVDDSITLKANFKHLIDGGYEVSGIQAKPVSGNATNKDVDARLEVLDYKKLDGKAVGDGVLDIKLGSYELMQLEFTKVPGKGTQNDTSNPNNGSIPQIEWDDKIIGHAGNESFWAGGGKDFVNGGGGNDKISGGRDFDLLTGGAGKDQFIFRSQKDSGAVAGEIDIITDFTRGQDKINLAHMDASSVSSGKQDFDYIGSAKFSGNDGELNFTKLKDSVIISADFDGDRKADISIELKNIAHLTEGDFIL